MDFLSLYSVWNEERVRLHHKLARTWDTSRPSHRGLFDQQINQAIHLVRKLLGNPGVFQGEGWGGVCFLACETSSATPSQPPPCQGEELFEAFSGIYLKT